MVVGKHSQPEPVAEVNGERKHFAPEKVSSMVLTKVKATADAY